MVGQVTIESRFRGPSSSGNGGYASGALARFLPPGPAEVTLRLPPPLDRPLQVDAGDAGSVTMRDGEALVAEARALDGLELELPEPVGVEAAEAARQASPFMHEHPFPECFVCGPQRRADDGLGITCGPAGGELVAAPWRVDASVADADGTARTEVVWAALDCPGGIATMLMPEVGVSVLGRLAVRIDAQIEAGTTCVAIGWPLGREGRKLGAGSAIFSAAGELLALARATWIELKG